MLESKNGQDNFFEFYKKNLNLSEEDFEKFKSYTTERLPFTIRVFDKETVDLIIEKQNRIKIQNIEITNKQKIESKNNKSEDIEAEIINRENSSMKQVLDFREKLNVESKKTVKCDPTETINENTSNASFDNNQCNRRGRKGGVHKTETSRSNDEYFDSPYLENDTGSSEFMKVDFLKEMNVFSVSHQKYKQNKILRDFITKLSNLGKVYGQEIVSMLPVYFLDIKKEHDVLDMCAAPGSKTTQILEICPNLLISNDFNKKRCDLMKNNTSRYYSEGHMITTYDSRHFPKIFTENTENVNKKLCAEVDKNEFGDSLVESSHSQNIFGYKKSLKILKFDRILCDVPCSGDGTFRKNGAIINKWKIKTSINLFAIQYGILKRGIDLLKEDGVLVYSTCSLNPIENEAVVQKAILENNIEVVPIHLEGFEMSEGLCSWDPMVEPSTRNGFIFSRDILELKNCRRIYPHTNDTGGFFIAVIRKKLKTVIYSGKSETDQEEIQNFTNKSESSQEEESDNLKRDVSSGTEQIEYRNLNRDVSSGTEQIESEYMKRDVPSGTEQIELDSSKRYIYSGTEQKEYDNSTKRDVSSGTEQIESDSLKRDISSGTEQKKYAEAGMSSNATVNDHEPVCIKEGAYTDNIYYEASVFLRTYFQSILDIPKDRYFLSHTKRFDRCSVVNKTVYSIICHNSFLNVVSAGTFSFSRNFFDNNSFCYRFKTDVLNLYYKKKVFSCSLKQSLLLLNSNTVTYDVFGPVEERGILIYELYRSKSKFCAYASGTCISVYLNKEVVAAYKEIYVVMGLLDESI